MGRWAARGMRHVALAFGVLLSTMLGGCDFIDTIVRVPIVDVGASFEIADTTWFEGEHTLFVFYQIQAWEGLGPDSVVEIAYRTNEVNHDWTPLADFAPVHAHVPVDCGARKLCGSYSIAEPLQPRDVRVRVRYHKDGALALDADPLSNHVVALGPAHTSRSAVMYGVFDEENLHVQWRLRHQFPAIRNEEATRLGLRRAFTVTDSRYGDLPADRSTFVGNPYGYGALPGCPDAWDTHVMSPVQTTDRAMFDTQAYLVPSYTAGFACGTTTVTDARGTFVTSALAQKNPQTRPAFAALRTPITENVTLPVLLRVCQDPTSDNHQDMQKQRTSMDESALICIDDWQTMGFSDRLATRISEKVDTLRQDGNDMVLVITLNRPDDEPGVAQAVEAALAIVLPEENDQASPRVSGAFVFDTGVYTITRPEVTRLTLWCPGTRQPDPAGGANPSATSCPLQRVQRQPLGDSISFAQLPILPSEDQYEKFIEEYGANQTGRVTNTTYRAPVRTPTSENVPVGDFGVATFFNNEAITPEATDNFSYCAEDDTGNVVVRVPGIEDLLPLSSLGEVHRATGGGRYELGLVWDFPFLMHLEYISVLAAQFDLPEQIPLIAAFGIGNPAEQYLGAGAWAQDRFEIGDALAQCTAFCAHPTFNSAGVYNVDDLFTDYASRCYRPTFPQVGDGGFPSDP